MESTINRGANAPAATAEDDAARRGAEALQIRAAARSGFGRSAADALTTPVPLCDVGGPSRTRRSGFFAKLMGIAQ